jgi:predicted nucleic acid-binding protein
VILVDTSVWIDFIRGRPTAVIDRLRTALDRGVEVALTPAIYQEILQGASDERTFRNHRSYFSGQRFLHPLEPVATYERAARLYFECRRKGLTIRSSNDCQVAQAAIEHGVSLMHDDRDFEQIAKVAPQLKFA